MASAYKSKGQYVADFRGYRMVSKQRRRVRLTAKTLAEAHARALALDAICRELEQQNIPDEDLVRYALKQKAITPADVAGILGDADESAPTVRDCALAHPSTIREKRTSEDYKARLRALADWERFGGAALVAHVTLAEVLRFVEWMVGQGMAWDTRRHRLIPIRRACQYATQYSIPDKLAGQRIDKREYKPVVALPSITLVKEWLLSPDPVVRRTVALGALCGLRPSEIMRADVTDLQDGLLVVGSRETKNLASRRTLPLPRLALDALETTATKGPLVISLHGHRLTTRNLNRRIAPAMQPFNVKTLRKVFATELIRAGVNVNLVEAYMGHTLSAVTAVTQRHYLAAYQAERLRPVAEAVDTIYGWGKDAVEK